MRGHAASYCQEFGLVSADEADNTDAAGRMAECGVAGIYFEGVVYDGRFQSQAIKYGANSG